MNVVTGNLLAFIAGVGVGYVVAVVSVLSILSATHQGFPMTERTRVVHRLARAFLILLAAGTALIAVHFVASRIDWQPVWVFSRAANKAVGPVVVACVLARVIPMLIDLRRWRDSRALHLLLWFLWISGATANATAAAFVTDGTPAWPAGVRLVLNVGAIVGCLWWPHPRKYAPIEEGSR